MQVKHKTFYAKNRRVPDKFKAQTRCAQMKELQKQVFQRSLIGLIMIFLVSQVGAEEKIIQQEKLSFEKCLKVITISQDKLSIAPEIEDVLDKKRVAVFTLVDGTLTITCDGVQGNVTVSTNTN